MNHKSGKLTMLSESKSRSIGNQSQNLPFSFLPRLYFLTFSYRRSTFVENPLLCAYCQLLPAFGFSNNLQFMPKVSTLYNLQYLLT